MANCVYMPPCGDVIEIVREGFLDIRVLPIVGIMPRLSIAMNLNHYTLMIPAAASAPLFDEGYLATQLMSYFNLRNDYQARTRERLTDI